jgi:hypothetical protein
MIEVKTATKNHSEPEIKIPDNFNLLERVGANYTL